MAKVKITEIKGNIRCEGCAGARAKLTGMIPNKYDIEVIRDNSSMQVMRAVLCTDCIKDIQKAITV